MTVSSPVRLKTAVAAAEKRVVQESVQPRPPGPLEDGAGARVLPFAVAVLVAVVSISLPAAAEHPDRLALVGVLAAVVFPATL